MALPRQRNTREMEAFVECADGSVARRVKVCDPIETSDSGAASSFSVSIHTTDATPNTETSFSIPANTKRFCIKNRGDVTIKVSPTSGFTINYFTLFGGNVWESGPLDGSGVTIYIECEQSSQVLEILKWA